LKYWGRRIWSYSWGEGEKQRGNYYSRLFELLKAGLLDFSAKVIVYTLDFKLIKWETTVLLRGCSSMLP
jgi:hypothetical protein